MSVLPDQRVQVAELLVAAIELSGDIIEGRLRLEEAITEGHRQGRPAPRERRAWPGSGWPDSIPRGQGDDGASHQRPGLHVSQGRLAYAAGGREDEGHGTPHPGIEPDRRATQPRRPDARQPGGADASPHPAGRLDERGRREPADRRRAARPYRRKRSAHRSFGARLRVKEFPTDRGFAHPLAAALPLC